MANLLGVNDMKAWALPAGVSAAELQRYAMIDGVTYETVVNDLLGILQAVNVVVLSSPIYSGMFSLTTELFYEYESGVAGTMEERSEYTVGDPRKTKTISHSIPVKGYEFPLKWTDEYLENANLNRLRIGLRAGGRAVKNNLERLILNRFFSASENQIDASGGGYDMPLANGGSTLVYIPVSHEGLDFASSHTHFDRQADSAAGRAAAVANGAEHLYHHGFMPPYDLIIPFADRADWAALNSASPYALWFKPERDNLTFATTTNMAAFGDETYVGGIDTAIGVVRVWATNRLPTDYAGMYKTYGNNAMGNPLVLRYKPTRGAGAILQSGPGFRNYPLEGVTIQHDFGVGVGSGRLNGYAVKFAASGDYSSPTIA